MNKNRKRTRYGRDAPDNVRASAAGAMITLTDADTWKILCGSGYKPIAECPEVQICVNIYAELILFPDIASVGIPHEA